MLVWLNATSAWAGPIAAILNFVIAAVGLPIAIYKGFQARRAIVGWFTNILGSAQHASDRSSDAATDARAAVDASTDAAESAGAARDNSRQANELLEWAIPEIMKRDAVIEDLKERIDRLVGTRVRQVVAERTEDRLTGLLAPITAADRDDAATVTGRHRLHTSLNQTMPQGLDDDSTSRP